ncbi:TPA: EexN family lipoprotein [Campylobacter fetus subsp. venerealis]|nr:EexN family lipoprotein [Campylobacter fetus subsp. venerealis]HDX6242809.1 EexN family lipoprotein [Campylobacter fetus subsp. venerealis]HDX6244556.1 EexN family lipoprotein [Campylobacter fetus subsp. venerealis]HDX6246561.1 EexN family lipoprotein [Campylobacter fetus subsp. venerealis]HDX6250528.1 EexN family lipoprotein [Campylobacter fetus subsp. venerealis]
MKKTVAFSVLLLGLFYLTGCFEEEIKTVEYFKTHADELEKTIAECKKADKMTESKKKECENAFKAQAMLNHFKPASRGLFEDEPQDKNTTK